eukprot:TRINITY_DN36932_c0_g1_i1.p1 TRINITY_DN36932_c0_g1~~TRINITY_DN36932_c0_g1_i1.p1  ORF type:complete len:507 (-),score=117.18 TRINITY_DN36932_c0_g1_i1:109-1566(-)
MAAARRSRSARSRTPPRVDAPSKLKRGRRPAQEAAPGKVAVASKTALSAAAVLPAAKAAAAAVAGGGSVFERAAAALKPAAFSGRLPCRDAEQDKIISHLRAAVRAGGTEQVLYVSGMPGTGKTAALLAAIDQMKTGPSLGNAFEFVHVNAMRLGAPGAIFNEVLGRLPGSRKCAVQGAFGEVSRFFTSRKAADPVVVLLIDEIDQLVTRSQAVLYNIFEWLSLPRPRLVIAAISNTMDLPERLLPRVASRFEITRVDFWPYTRDQIHTILTERLRSKNAMDAFTQDALRRCAARVAAGSGDVRKALQLCRRATETAAAAQQPAAAGVASGMAPTLSGEAPKQVTGQILDMAVKELLYGNPAAKAVAGLSSRTRRVLVSLLLELRKQDSEVVALRRVATRYDKLTQTCFGQELPVHGSHAEDAAFIVDRLEAMSLIVVRGKAVCPAPGQTPSPGLGVGASLDAEDLCAALVAAEDDAGIRELLRD